MPDAIARAPAGSAGRTRRRAAAPPQPARRSVMSFFTARPGVTLAALAGAAMLTGVLVNALFLQRGPHPAPLFAAAPPTREPARQPQPQLQPSAPPPALTPTPVPRPAQFSAAPAAQTQPAPPAPVARAASVTPAKERASDQIGDLLRGGPSTHAATQTVAADAGGSRVAAAQRALEKLGYGVTVDGVYGSGTRAAVQRFERERNLPVTGDLNARTLRELAERSGLPVL